MSGSYLRFCKSCPVDVRLNRNLFAQAKAFFTQEFAYDSDNRPLPYRRGKVGGPVAVQINYPLQMGRHISDPKPQWDA